MARKALLVPVRLNGGGIYHDTDYMRGTDSREEAERINDELRAEGPDEYGHDQAIKYVSYVMETVEPFTASLWVKESHKGYSSAYVILEDASETQEWPMFFADFVRLTQHARIDNGAIELMAYQVCKMGQAYGIRPVMEA